jgi:hypothetical protein
MKNKYSGEDEILELVRAFESASISREDWRHAEHLVVGLYYLTRHDLATATEKMRLGIFNLLRNAFNVDLEKEMPYHETLTVFWMNTLAEFNARKNGDPLLDKANEVAACFDKDYPLRYYSRELLFSDAARASYIEPDLVPAGSGPVSFDA